MHVLALIAAVAVLLFLATRRLRLDVRQRPPTEAELTPNPALEKDVAFYEFGKRVLDTSEQTPVLVGFQSERCGPCQAFAPLLTWMVNHCAGRFLLARVDIEESDALAADYQVSSVPTVLLFRNRQVVDRVNGAMQPHALAYFLRKNGIDVPAQA